MASVEETYRRYWGQVGGAGRLRRAFSLFVNMRSMLELQVRNEDPGIDEREARRRTAQRMYRSDPCAPGLLDRTKGQNVTHDDFPETVARISAILQDLGLRNHVRGGVAASYHGLAELEAAIQQGRDRPPRPDET